MTHGHAEGPPAKKIGNLLSANQPLHVTGPAFHRFDLGPSRLHIVVRSFMITSHDRDLYHDEYQYHYWCQYYHCPLLLSLLLLFWKNHYFQYIFSLSLNLSLKPCLPIGNRVLRRNKCEKGKLTNDKDTLILGPTPRVENHKTFRKIHPRVDVTSSGFSTS